MKLLHGDCLELMKEIPNNSIDMAVIDPPYKLNKTTGGISTTGFTNRWQGNLKGSDKKASIINDIEFDEWLPEVYRLLKPQSHCYIWTNDKNLSDLICAAERVGFRLHNILVWKKNNCTPNRWYMKNCEFILFLYKGNAKPINDKSSSQFFEIQNKNGKNKLHPTEKPVKVIEKLICNSSDENDTVLDCFMGSGSTGIACLNTCRDFVGMELDASYFQIACKRIEEAQRQKKMENAQMQIFDL